MAPAEDRLGCQIVKIRRRERRRYAAEIVFGSLSIAAMALLAFYEIKPWITIPSSAIPPMPLLGCIGILARFSGSYIRWAAVATAITLQAIVLPPGWSIFVSWGNWPWLCEFSLVAAAIAWGAGRPGLGPGALDSAFSHGLHLFGSWIPTFRNNRRQIAVGLDRRVGKPFRIRLS
jgi:hypothetical protein